MFVLLGIAARIVAGVGCSGSARAGRTLPVLRVDPATAPEFAGIYPGQVRNARRGSVKAGEVSGSDPGYRLAEKGREYAEDERLDLLEQLFDPGSRRHRALVQRACRCLEIGAGRGSMATWLAERVGPASQVVATDIDCRYVARLDLPNLQVLQHNIVEDPLDVLGPGSFDLACADAQPPIEFTVSPATRRPKRRVHGSP